MPPRYLAEETTVRIGNLLATEELHTIQRPSSHVAVGVSELV